MKNEMKIKGLQNVCSLTKGLANNGNGRYYIDLYYDMDTHEAWGAIRVSENTWTCYRGMRIIHCGAIQAPMTMDKIREIIEENLEMYTDPETLED